MLALGFVALSAAPSDDPSDPFGDVAARRGRSEGVDVSTDRRSPSCEVIDGGNMSRTSAKGRCQGVEGVSPILMGEMGALFVVGFGVGLIASSSCRNSWLDSSEWVRGSEVLPDVVAGSTGDQPPVAMITANPAMTPDPSPSSTEPAGSDVGGPGSSDQA